MDDELDEKLSVPQTKTLIGGRAWIPKGPLPKSHIDGLRDKNTVRLKPGPYDEEATEVEMYEERDFYLGVARGFYHRTSRGGIPKEYYVSQNRRLFVPECDPRDEMQERCVSTLTDYFRDREAGEAMLKSGVGTGKTVMALLVAARLEYATLILVHKEYLMNQWRTRIEEDPAVIPDANVGVFQGDEEQFGEDYDIVIGMVQTLTNRDPDHDIFGWPGFVVADECIHGDDEVLTSKGYMPASEVYNRHQSGEDIDLLVPESEDGLVESSVTNSWEHKSDHAIQVDFEGGSSIKATPDHEFLVAGTDGSLTWREAEGLVPGDYVVSPDGLDVSIPDIQGHEDAYFAGLFVGDGHFLRDGVIRFCFSKDVQWWIDTLKRLCGARNVSVRENDRCDVNILVEGSYPSIVRDLGFTPGAKTGDIPRLDIVEQWGFEGACWFVRGLFDAEGSVLGRGGGSESVRLDMTDKMVVSEVEGFLSSIGIGCSSFVRERESENHSTIYAVSLWGDRALKFGRKVGFGMPRKQARLMDIHAGGENDGMNVSGLIQALRSEGVYDRIMAGESMARQTVTDASSGKPLGKDLVQQLIDNVRGYIDHLDISNWAELNESLLTYQEVADESDSSIATVWNWLSEDGKYSDRDPFDHDVGSVAFQLAEQKIGRIRSIVRKWDWASSCWVKRVRGVTRVESDGEAFYDFEVTPHHRFVCNDVVVHNCHRMAAPTFNKVIHRFNAAYRMGMTATPRRKDDGEQVFFDTLGEIEAEGSSPLLTPKVRLAKTSFELHKDSYPTWIEDRILIRDNSRNEYISRELQMARKQGRNILVLSRRVEHLFRIYLRAKRKLRNPDVGVAAGSWYVDEDEAEKWVQNTKKYEKNLQNNPSLIDTDVHDVDREGGEIKSVKPKRRSLSQEEVEEACESDILLATHKKVSEGFDVPNLDTLFITYPISDPEQETGRILRPKEGKQDPIVTHFVDPNVPRYWAMWKKCRYIYKGRLGVENLH